MSDDLSLWDISTGIRDAVARIEEAQRDVWDSERGGSEAGMHDGNLARAELAQALEALLAYMMAEVKAVDGAAEYILFCRAQGEQGRAKEKQVGKVAQGWENRAQRIEDAVMYCLRASGSKLEESAIHKLRRQTNGGKVGLTIADPDRIANKYKRWILAPLEYSRYCELVTALETVAPGHAAEVASTTVTEPDKKAIREALERNEVVFGCSLDERGEQLRVE